MINNVNNNGNNKDWIGLDNATKDKDYQKIIDEQISSIMNGKETISKAELQKNSLFANLSDPAALKKFNNIAAMDSDFQSFSKDEMKILLTLSDAKLQQVNGQNEFVLDGKFDDVNNSGLKSVTNEDFVKANNNLVLEKAMTDYTDKATGKKMNVLEITQKFKEFEQKSGDKFRVGNYYKNLCAGFEEETGIKISNLQRARGTDGDRYSVGDYKVHVPWSGIITAEKQKQGESGE